jgi:hypothetical protein
VENGTAVLPVKVLRNFVAQRVLRVFYHRNLNTRPL